MIKTVRLDRISIRLLLRCFVGISALIGFYYFFDLHAYLPWKARILKALGRTVELHLGLWLATIEMRSRWRYIVIVLLIPSWVGTYLFFWHRNSVTLIAGSLIMIWLIRDVLRGQRLEAQAI